MPSYLDLGVIAVILVSAFLAMLRGFTREVLAIASWVAAAGAALFFYFDPRLHPLVLPYVKPYIEKETVALGVSAAAIFVLTLIIVSLVTVRLSDAILGSRVGALDRSLGFVFGAARGLLLCVIAFAFFNWLVPEQSHPEWVKSAKVRPFLEQSGEELKAILPEDPEGFLSKLKKPSTAKSTEEPVPEGDAEPKGGTTGSVGKRT